jgi:hypothetical protein
VPLTRDQISTLEKAIRVLLDASHIACAAARDAGRANEAELQYLERTDTIDKAHDARRRGDQDSWMNLATAAALNAARSVLTVSPGELSATNLHTAST